MGFSSRFPMPPTTRLLHAPLQQNRYAKPSLQRATTTQPHFPGWLTPAVPNLPGCQNPASIIAAPSTRCPLLSHSARHYNASAPRRYTAPLQPSSSPRNAPASNQSNNNKTRATQQHNENFCDNNKPSYRDLIATLSQRIFFPIISYRTRYAICQGVLIRRIP